MSLDESCNLVFIFNVQHPQRVANSPNFSSQTDGSILLFCFASSHGKKFPHFYLIAFMGAFLVSKFKFSTFQYGEKYEKKSKSLIRMMIRATYSSIA